MKQILVAAAIIGQVNKESHYVPEYVLTQVEEKTGLSREQIVKIRDLIQGDLSKYKLFG